MKNIQHSLSKGNVFCLEYQIPGLIKIIKVVLQQLADQTVDLLPQPSTLVMNWV